MNRTAFSRGVRRVSRRLRIGVAHGERQRACVAVLAGTMLLAGTARTESPLALSCIGCHQPKINSASMPALSNLAPAAIAKSLRRARDRPEFGSIMARFAAKLSDADIEQLSKELGKPDQRR